MLEAGANDLGRATDPSSSAATEPSFVPAKHVDDRGRGDDSAKGCQSGLAGGTDRTPANRDELLAAVARLGGRGHRREVGGPHHWCVGAKVRLRRRAFEIGVRNGFSLIHVAGPESWASTRSSRSTRSSCCDVHLVRSTSDEFFARAAPLRAPRPSPVVDLAFIDGMHLAEYALRDLINTERYMPLRPASIVHRRHAAAFTVDEAEPRAHRQPPRPGRVGG